MNNSTLYKILIIVFIGSMIALYFFLNRGIEEREEMKIEIENNDQEKAGLRDTIHMYQGSMTRLEDENKNLNDTIIELKVNNQSLRDSLQGLQQDNDQLKEDYNIALQENKELEKENEQKPPSSDKDSTIDNSNTVVTTEPKKENENTYSIQSAWDNYNDDPELTKAILDTIEHRLEGQLDQQYALAMYNIRKLVAQEYEHKHYAMCFIREKVKEGNQEGISPRQLLFYEYYEKFNNKRSTKDTECDILNGTKGKTN